MKNYLVGAISRSGCVENEILIKGISGAIQQAYIKSLKLDALISIKQEKINPEDDIVLSNIAQAYKLKEDFENAIKYYEKVMLYGNEDIIEFAKYQIEQLKGKK